MAEAIMGNARFFRRSGPYPLGLVTDTAGGTAEDLELLLEGVAPLQTAGPNEVSFLGNKRYASALDQTLAGAVIVHPPMAARCQRARWLSKQLNPMLLGHVWPHCSIPCRRFLQAFTRPQLLRRGRT